MQPKVCILENSQHPPGHKTAGRKELSLLLSDSGYLYLYRVMAAESLSIGLCAQGPGQVGAF